MHSCLSLAEIQRVYFAFTPNATGRQDPIESVLRDAYRANYSLEKTSDKFCCHTTLSPCTGERIHEDLWRDKFVRVEIFQLWREFRVMTANQRATSWPLSDICTVTANQRSTDKLSAVQSVVNCSIVEKVIVAVCDSRSSIYKIVYNIIV